MQSIKDLVKQEVQFIMYRKGELHYQTLDSNFKFVVPIEDCGDGEFHRNDSGIYFMRYIRKQLEANQAGLEAQ